jgi:alpha-glucosidase
MFTRALVTFFLFVVLFSSCQSVKTQKILEISSPDKLLKVGLFTRENSENLWYTLSHKDIVLVDFSPISMEISGIENLSFTPTNLTLFDQDSLIYPLIASKRKLFQDQYSAVKVEFEGPLDLELRMYDEGAAFRWIGKTNGVVEIQSETFEINTIEPSQLFYAPYEQVIPDSWRAYLGIIRDRIQGFFDVSYPYENHFETQYQRKNLTDLRDRELLNSPALLQSKEDLYLLVAESDVRDYPGMILKKSGDNGLKATFAPFPLEEVIPVDTLNYFRLKKVSKTAPFIASTSGKRSFPWRIIFATDNPTILPESDLVLKLASPSELSGDLSWIKPGQITDEWMTNANLFDVAFKAGKNTETYLYYIDFAKDFGLEYIMVDEGWYRNGDLKRLNPEIDLNIISDYAEERGIGLGLWFNATDLELSLEESLSYYSSIGVKIVLVDFINRNDQKAMNFFEKLAVTCANYRLMLNLHSAPAPGGFEITFPNAITREGVMGSEWNGWTDFVTPSHNVTIPFTRMVSGSLDYEPGLLENSNEDSFRTIWGRPMSLGTRSNQLAMYIVYDNPLQYFVGNPAQGRKEPEFMTFLGSLPTTWDETIILEGKPGEHIVTARYKEGIWYLGAMSNWTERQLIIDLSPLGITNYDLYGIIDGINANNYASDYQFIKLSGLSEKTLKLNLAKGGGAVIKIHPY